MPWGGVGWGVPCTEDRNYGHARVWHKVGRGWLGSLFCFLINYTSFPNASIPGLKSHLP